MNIHSLPRHPRSPPARQTRRSVKDVSGQSVKDVMGLNTLKTKGGAPVKPTAGTTPAGRALDYELIPPSEDEGGAPANHNTNCKTTRTTNRKASAAWKAALRKRQKQIPRSPRRPRDDSKSEWRARAGARVPPRADRTDPTLERRGWGTRKTNSRDYTCGARPGLPTHPP